MEVAELWRYPVKSMAGEQLATAEVSPGGVNGDRSLAAFALGPGATVQPLSARQLPALLKYRAAREGDAVLVAGPELDPVAWDDQAVGTSLRRECRRPVQLRKVPWGAFDDSPILMVHLDTTAALSTEMAAPVDHRRFRANLYLRGEGIEAHGEPQLVGREIRCGDVVLEATKACQRCSITTRDPDTWEVWPQLLRQVVQVHHEMVGVYCRVLVPGRLARGDPVEFI
jgi:hypothetical protein